MNRQKPPRFCYSKALIVEGLDDFQFVLSLCKKLEIDQNIYIHSIGGKSNLAGEDSEGKSLLNAARSSEFKDNVKHLAILVDGDGDSQKTFEDIKKATLSIGEKINELEFFLPEERSVIKNIAQTKSNKELQIPTFAYIFEKDLEDIFIQSLGEGEKRILDDCVSKFFECAKPEKITDKNRVQALLSNKKEVRDIGSAAKKNQINFQHSCFDDLKKFLIDFSKL